MKTHKDLVIDIQNFLRKFLVEEKTSMELISNELQSIEHDLKEIDNYNKHIDSVASELEEQR